MILRKYLAWLSSTAILVGFSSVVLPHGFSQIVDWIGPLFGGGGLRLELQLLFLFLGPSLTYAPLLLLWITAGIVGGFFARGVLRSMAAGTISVLTLLALIVANGYLLFKQSTSAGGQIFSGGSFPVQSMGSGGFNFPPPPEGFSLIDLLSAPLVGETVQQFTTGTLNPVAMIGMLVRNVLVNVVLYAVSFTLSSYAFSRVLAGRSAKPPQPTATPSVTVSPSTLHLKVFAILLLVFVLVLPGLYQASGSNGESSSTTFLGEKLGLLVSSDGSLGMAYYRNVSSLPGIPTDYQREEFQGLYGAVFYAFQGLVECPSETFFLDAFSDSPAYEYVASYFSIVPRNGFLAIYQVDDPSKGRTRADQLATEFAESFDVSLRFATDLYVESATFLESSGDWYGAVYVGDGNATEIGGKVIDMANADGVGAILTPERVLQKHLAVAAALLRPDLENEAGKPILAVGMLSDLTPISDFKERGTFTLGLNEIFDHQGEIHASAVSASTQVLLAFPPDVAISDSGPPEALAHQEDGLVTLTLNATYPHVPDVFVTFDHVFPGRIQVDRKIAPSSPFPRGTKVTETVTVTNPTDEVLRDVTVSEKRLFETYPTLRLVSPASHNITIGDIQPNTSATAEYQFEVQAEGVYTLPSVEVTYADDGETVRKSSCPVSIRSTFNLTMYAQEFIAATAPASYALITLTLLPPLVQIPKLLFRKKPGP